MRRLRRFLCILLLLIYLLPATGFSMSLHKCGKKTTLKFYDGVHKATCKCTKKMPPGCCRGFEIKAQLLQNHQTVSGAILQNQQLSFSSLYPIIAGIYQIPDECIKTLYFLRLHAPPDKPGTPVYLSNRVIRI